MRGGLGATSLGNDSTRLQLAGFMTYDYISNEVIDFGGQGFMGGIIAQSDRAKKILLHGEALARFMPIAAVRSDYFVTAEGRDYDYGVGIGARLNGSAIYNGVGSATLTGGYLWLPVVSGFSGNHHLFTLAGEARGYYKGKYGAGLGFSQALAPQQVHLPARCGPGLLRVQGVPFNDHTEVGTMNRSSRLMALGGLSALTLLIGCLDSIVRELGPENNPQVTNTASSFEFKAEDMENVNDELIFNWVNSAPQAAVPS